MAEEGFVEGVMHLNPCLVTPSSLYRALNRAHSPIVQVVPSKMMNHTTGDETITLAKNNALGGNMTKELLSTFRLAEREEVQLSISQSFVQNHLLHPENRTNKRLVMFYNQ
jgi:hypothetical protein